jgi:Ser/Thr protein kinase RdoA (MazF antagonist)
VPSETLARILDQLGVAYRGIVALSDVPSGNGNWLVQTAGEEPAVLRRYRSSVTAAEIAYEHDVLRHLYGAGWTVPAPVTDLIQHDGAWYCLTRYVPGTAVRPESAAQSRRRGRDLARLHLALRGLAERIGQRPGFHPQHSELTTRIGFDWDAAVSALEQANRRLAAWAQSAADQISNALNAAGVSELPLTVIHGDFAEWNVHYQDGHLSGVVDFDLTHLDSRPYELAIARTYRAPEAVIGYRTELARSGWPLSDLEEAAIEPVYRAFRLGMAAWEIHHGRETGTYNVPMIERQLSMTGPTRQPRPTTAPWSA